MASDLISRSALLAEYDSVHIGEPGGARKLIAEAPAVDAVEVVRCKDCKFWHTDWIPRSCERKPWRYCEMIDGISSQNHFCAYGKRRQEDAVD